LDIDAVVPLDKKWGNHKIFCKDTGIGIKVDNNEKIFNSFVQEDNSTRKFGGGIGTIHFKPVVGIDGVNYNSSANMVEVISTLL
jgi:signal transduction histidine kinase